ncbi:hypothetical protein M2451_000908 [Dysgonomonas sp. PFB1-18]|nr:hypothetical protein [Dysgonomonas sp. PF1-14]MDH6338098.1 hypothetical protein [Dysgonomonas sp. PF1-16]MDH6379595.1 hypothetical protein [Dysgonomonas sp. PFB1-18]MDH6396925.1 hypothetical protein [Dysgonomonas sp. PF1-23]
MSISTQDAVRFATVFPSENLEVSSILLERERERLNNPHHLHSKSNFLNLILFTYYSMRTLVCMQDCVHTRISLTNNLKRDKSYLIFLTKKLNEVISTAYHRICRKRLHRVSNIQIQCLKKNEGYYSTYYQSIVYCLQYCLPFITPPSICENRSRVLQCIVFSERDLINNYMNFNT